MEKEVRKSRSMRKAHAGPCAGYNDIVEMCSPPCSTVSMNQPTNFIFFRLRKVSHRAVHVSPQDTPSVWYVQGRGCDLSQESASASLHGDINA